jgi:hypothetical protein
MAPGVSLVAGLLLMIPAFQMIMGHAAPVFPKRIASHPFPRRHLAALVQRAVPVLRYLEKIVHPRWHAMLEQSSRLVGLTVLLLSTVLVFIPVPMTNVIPAMVIALIALAWIEEDGLLLAMALSAAALVLAVVVAGIWETVLGAVWISRLW